MLASLNAERLKMRRLWLPAIALGSGIIILLLVSLNLSSAATRVATEDNLDVPWQAGVIGDAAVTMNLVLPALAILVTALSFFVEHRGDMWKQLRAAPPPIWTVYAAKFVIIQSLIALALVVAAAGAMAGWPLLPDMFRRELADSAVEACRAIAEIAAALYVSLLPLSAVQFCLSARMANILHPVGIGLVLTFANLLAMSPSTAAWLPYAYPGAVIIQRFPPPDAAERQVTDADYRAPADAFAGGSDSGGGILIDEAHGNRHHLGDPEAPGTLSWIARPAKAGGLPLHATRDFSPQRLAQARLLVIAGASRALSPAQIDGVVRWVHGGGSLLLLTDHEPFASPAAELAGRFGVGYSKDMVRLDRRDASARIQFTRAAGNLRDHAITRGAKRVLTYGGQAIWRSEPRTAVLLALPSETFGEAGQPIRASGAAQLIAFEAGRGRVVVSGESGVFTAQRAGDGARIGVADQATDNEILVIGALRWLLRLPRGR